MQQDAVEKKKDSFETKAIHNSLICSKAGIHIAKYIESIYIYIYIFSEIHETFHTKGDLPS